MIVSYLNRILSSSELISGSKNINKIMDRAWRHGLSDSYLKLNKTLTKARTLVYKREKFLKGRKW